MELRNLAVKKGKEGEASKSDSGSKSEKSQLPKAEICCKHCQDFKYCDERGKCCEYCDHFVKGLCAYLRDKKLLKNDTDFTLEDYRGDEYGIDEAEAFAEIEE
ncbi:MAG: hypothetical protein ABH950_03450 [Candidatus Altiarchaeota archaeon]